MKSIIFFFMLTLSACIKQDEYKLTILHVNDTHAKHEPSIRVNTETGVTTTNGGEAQFAGVVSEERSKNPNTLVVHAGDIMTGSAYTIVYKGLESAELMNMSGISVATLGNHEFDYGLQGAYDILEIENFPTVSANVFEQDTGNYVVPPYVLTNLGGKTLALIGLMVNEEVFTERLNTPGFIRVENGIDTLKKLFEEDQTLNSADYFILISHSGFDFDKQIAQAFPGKFSAIVGGHSHTLLPEPVIIKGTPIVQLDNNLRRVGRLDLSFKGKKMEINYKQIPLSNTAYNTVVAEYIANKKILVDERLGVKIGRLIGDDLDDEGIRKGSVPLANYIADTLQDLHKDKNIDFTVFNSGSLRSPLLQGDITIRSLFELYPFDNILVVANLTGTTIKDMFAVSALKNWDEGGFLQVSKGVAIYTDNQRNITNILLNDKELDPNKEYTVLLTDWIYHGGDNYTMIEPNAKNPQFLGSDIRKLFIDTIRSQRVLDARKIDQSHRWFFGVEAL
ncbi:MAG: bifunctional metallophosphatase/5'-nucleotidase [Brevinema sp.]